MNATVAIQPKETTREGIAPVELLRDDGERLCHLDVQYSKLAPLCQPNARATDFLLLAAGVYALDKLVLRETAVDSWTREFSLMLPVSDVAAWVSVKRDLDACLSYLSGDIWNVGFVAQDSTPIRPLRRRRRRRRPLIPPPSGDAVCLFSGGLDSLIGAIDWLESHAQQTLLLTGHHDGQIAGPYADQRALLDKVRIAYPGRIHPILARVGHTGESAETTEISLRSRSLVFVALGVFAASALGPNVSLIIPENGTIALNVPLTPSRRGSCSTRTAHAHYLAMLGSVLSRVGLVNAISNPLETKTKGQAVAQCLNRDLLNNTARLSVSCAKRGHKIHWTHRDANGCGRCMPCIYRRAALHTVGWDDERYGDDICQGEVNLQDNSEKPNDLRACFSFLTQNPSLGEISARLIASGSLDVRRLPCYAAMVQRTMEEIRTLLRDKAIGNIKRLARL
ncbi:MAG: hypothetical protein HYR84_03575 [Planctomycetes bacterium]|nr:hypothetical protein [Planctomycetota bacterium]